MQKVGHNARTQNQGHLADPKTVRPSISKQQGAQFANPKTGPLGRAEKSFGGSAVLVF